jgi:hypothetical protein
MGKIKSGDRCADCKHMNQWKTDRSKASCRLHHEEGFHPDRPVPTKCVDKVDRKY